MPRPLPARASGEGEEEEKAMGTMMIGAKYRTTLRDPGTSGVLSMVRAILAPRLRGSAPLRPLPSETVLLLISEDCVCLCGCAMNLGLRWGGYIFEFDNVGDRELCRDFVARVFAEMEQRMKLLREDSELRKLHKKFVVSSILQESEFWAIRKNLLDDEANKALKQKPGVKNVMVADVRPSADGQIFAEKPAMHRAFLDYVPKKIKRFDPTFDMEVDAGDDYIHLPDHGILCDGTKETADTDIELARRTLSQDLNRHAAVVLEGRSTDIKSADTKTVAEALARSRKERPFSSVADDASHERLVKMARMTEIEDLQVPRSIPYAPLRIKDPREYFHSQQANALRSLGGNNDVRKAHSCSLSTDDAFRHLMDQISSAKLNCLIVQSDVALKALDAAFNHDLDQQQKSSKPGNSPNRF
ncbi:hypothetical protein ACQ4PT_032052 [Festuca glaucescens]